MAVSILDLLRNKCPECQKGNVFKNPSLYHFSFPVINEECSNCHTKFSKEPGYFFGAMYINYGLNVIEGITTYFIICQFFDKTFDLMMFPIISSVLILLTFINIRFSRIIWMYLFRNYSV